MNERIKELAEQASHQSPDGYPVTIPYSKVFAKKFAELIVKDCARVADRWVEDEDNGHNLVSERLRQHFGVKE
jgi:hypothetical protein